MKGVQDFYNETAPDWADKWYEDTSLIPYLKEFFSFLPNNPRVLDLCCGAGYESMRMASLGAEVVGLDFSAESINVAKTRNPNIKFINEDMLNDYSYIGKFNGCAVIAGLVHLTEDKLNMAFQRISSVLYDNGYLFIVVEDGQGKNSESSFVNINGIDYDRDFYRHSLNTLIASSKNIFKYIKEINLDNDPLWKYYIFKKEVV
ncbi:MAG: class I SAM-dependent methyltransferase [Clostridium sp.]|uniref:class I SAM-dependent methyltransferase n=1 Tax=Clostridium sp. TaxID=1506 RepID=UPI002FC981C9